MIESCSPDQRIYEKEFELNIKHSFPNPKELINIAYQIDNMVLATLIIPKDFIKIGKETECDCKMFIGGSGELCPECKTKVKLNLNKSNTKIKKGIKHDN
jgi:hypothetical protein